METLVQSALKAPVSRRERPAKPALTREGIVASALGIFRREGLDRVTMRRIASALDTGPASLYVYFRDTEDLHACILDALLEPVVQLRPRGDWRQKLHAVLRGYLELLFANPALARMAMGTPANGTNYLLLVERVLGLLADGGVKDREAGWAVDALLLFTTAAAAEHASWKESPRAAETMSGLGDTMRTLDPNTFPNIRRVGDELLSGDGDRFTWHLDVLLNGVLRTPRSSAGHSPARNKESR